MRICIAERYKADGFKFAAPSVVVFYAVFLCLGVLLRSLSQKKMICPIGQIIFFILIGTVRRMRRSVSENGLRSGMPQTGLFFID